MTDQPRAPALPDVPDALATSIDRAQTRTLGRRHGPVVELKQRPGGGLEWDWPFRDGGDAEWKWLVVDAFGTRNANVAACFVNHLLDLCASKLDEGHNEWVPDAVELSTMLHIVSAHRPGNEAQAALAAQIAATHLITMRVAKRAADYPYDTRMIGAYAKLIRASAAQIETMAVMKGRRRTARQHISVSHEKHVHSHHHQHVHMGGGAVHEQDQPDEPRQHTAPDNLARARTIEGSAPVPSATKARSRRVRSQGDAG